MNQSFQALLFLENYINKTRDFRVELQVSGGEV